MSSDLIHFYIQLMKKRKIFLLIILILTIGVIWLIEPISFNPFSQVKSPETQSKINFKCEDSSFAVNNDHYEWVKQLPHPKI